MSINHLRNLIKKSDAILITAGAGIGVDSGLSTYENVEDFHRAYPELKEKKLTYSEIVNPKWFQENPSLIWDFYIKRLDFYNKTTPHEGFKFLLDLVESKNNNYFVFTSNVDGQFQKAGFNEEKIFEIHGSIHYLQCLNNCNDKLFPISEELIMGEIPKCPYCGSIARPNILMFADWKWDDTRAYFQEKRFNNWLSKIKNNHQRLMIIEIGAGTTIPTVRKMSDKISSEYDRANLIRINPDEYQVCNSNSHSLALRGLEGIRKMLGDLK